MSELLWDEVDVFFDPGLSGALPDGCVPGTTVEDWQALLDLVGSSGWAWEVAAGRDTVPGPLPTAARLLERSPDDEWHVLRVWPVPGVQVNLWPLDPDRIDYDFDLRELQGQAGVDVVCGFLTAVGRRLGKPAGMGSEGSPDPVIEYDPALDRVVLREDAAAARRGRR